MTRQGSTVAVALLVAAAAAACSSSTSSSAARSSSGAPSSAPAATTGAAGPLTAAVTACASAADGDRVDFTVTNTGSAAADATVFPTINGAPVLQLHKADPSQPDFGTQGIHLDPGATFKGWAQTSTASSSPKCDVQARVYGS